MLVLYAGWMSVIGGKLHYNYRSLRRYLIGWNTHDNCTVSSLHYCSSALYGSGSHPGPCWFETSKSATSKKIHNMYCMLVEIT